MGKSFASIVLVVVALCISSSLALNSGNHPAVVRGPGYDAKRTRAAIDKFFVEGKVYCDPCQFEFESRLSKSLSGVKVVLECRKADGVNTTYSKEAITNAYGFYTLNVIGDHEDEICAVRTELNTHKHCNVPMKTSDSDRVVLTKHDGVSSPIRFVNPLGFKTQKINAECAKVYQELELDTLDN